MANLTRGRKKGVASILMKMTLNTTNDPSETNTTTSSVAAATQKKGTTTTTSAAQRTVEPTKPSKDGRVTRSFTQCHPRHLRQMPAFPAIAIGGINEEDSSSSEDYGVLANTFGRGLAKKVIGPIKSNDKQNRVRERKTTLTTMKKMMQR